MEDEPFNSYNPNLIPGLDRLKRVGEIIGRFIPHFLPEQPLATHGDHLPTEMRGE